jgi:hypothetical protein
LQPPAGAGNVVTVFVPGLAEILAVEGTLIITIPEPPEAPAVFCWLPPPPPPVLAVPATPFIGPGAFLPSPPPPAPPGTGLAGAGVPLAAPPPPPA